MAILRNKTRNQYTVVIQSIIRDERLSLKALGLLVKLMSFPDDWKFSERGLQYLFKKDGQSSIRSGLKELEDFGYLTRSRARDEKGQMAEAIWVIHEIPIKPVNNPDDNPDNPNLGNQSLDSANLENRLQSNTNISITNKPIIKGPIYPINPDATKTDGMGWDRVVKRNIDYERWKNEPTAKEIADLIIDTVTSTANYIKINGSTLPLPRVRERFLTLTDEHIAYIIDAMKKQSGNIRNIRAYLLTSLYNAPTTMRTYYQSEVNHDLDGEK